MAALHKIADPSDFSADGDRVIREIEGVEIAVFRIEGEFYAIANYCVHQGGPLCEGELTGQVSVGEDGWSWEYDEAEKCVLCPWHGWMFDVTTGKNVDVDRYTAPTYEVTVKDDGIYVSL